MFESLSPSEIVALAVRSHPSAEVIAALSTVPAVVLTPEEHVDLLVAWDRMACWITAQLQPALVRVGALAEAAAEKCMEPGDGYGGDMPLRAAHAEIGAALRVGNDNACRRLEIARALTGHLAAVQAELSAGRITYVHAMVICEATYRLDDDTAAAVAERVLKRAWHQTVAAMRRCLNRAVIKANPAAAAERAARAKAGRGIEVRPAEDGMAQLTITAAAADIQRLFTTADAIAKTMPKIGSDGAFLPIAARRVDAFINLATGDHSNCPAATDIAAGDYGKSPRKPVVHARITIDLLTLLGLQHNPVELDGYGPLTAEAGRALAADAKTWRRLICDPFTGALLDLGVTTYEPSPALSRFIQTRDRHCTFPGCHQPAWRCDLDHIIPFRQGCCGPTDRSNLGPLCRSHHRLKHETGWHKQRDQQTGQTTWRSPLGKHYRLEPIDFRGDPDSDPFNWPDDPPTPAESFEPERATEDQRHTKLNPQTAGQCPF